MAKKLYIMPIMGMRTLIHGGLANFQYFFTEINIILLVPSKCTILPVYRPKALKLFYLYET